MTTALTTTNIVDPFQAIDRAGKAETTTRQYKRAIELYLASGGNLSDASQLADYARDLKSSPKSFLKAAILLWSKEVERHVRANSTPETALAVMATRDRLSALVDAIKIKQSKGHKSHNWLSGSQVKHLREVIKDDRDYLIIVTLLQAGLRRNEVVTLKREDVTMLGDMHIIHILGKGEKFRDVPIRPELAQRLKNWGNGEVIFELTGQTIANICKRYGKMIDLPTLAPHDLRRTFAQCCLDNGVPINQISQLLGHSSIATTQRYLDLDVQNLPTIGDFMTF